MNNTFQIDENYALAFGLDWFVLDPLDSKYAKLTELWSNGARWMVSFKQNGEVNIGSTGEIGQFGRKSTLLSGAAQIAAMPAFAGKTVLVLMEDQGEDGNSGLVAVVGLINGNVSIDALLSPSEVVSARQRFHDRCESSGLEYTTAGLVLSIAQVEIPLEWGDLLPQKVSRFKTTPEFRVKTLKSGRSTQIATSAIVLVIVAGAGGLAYQKYSDYQQRQRELKAAQKVDPEILYAASSQSFLNEPQALAKDAFPILRSTLGHIPTYFAGWQLKTVDCQTIYCIFTWERDGGTFQEFKERAPKEWTNIAFSDDGTTLTNRITLSIPKQKLPDKANWLEKESFKETVVSQWQRYADIGFQYVLGPTSLQAVPPGITAETVENSPNAIRAVSWEIKPGSNWYTSEGFDYAPDYVTFDNLKLTIGKNEITFEARGNVYVKK